MLVSKGFIANVEVLHYIFSDRLTAIVTAISKN